MFRPSKFENELRAAINSHSKENASNTPDYVLARYLRDCLNAFDTAVQYRAMWYGRMDTPGGVET